MGWLGPSLVMSHPFLVGLLTALISLQTVQSSSECSLIGVGGCRGGGWADGVWPKTLGRQSLENCCKLCQSDEQCTSIHVTKEGGCLTFGHQYVTAVKALGGHCYNIARTIAKKTPEIKKVPAKETAKNPTELKKEPSKETGKNPTEIKKEPAKETAKHPPEIKKEPTKEAPKKAPEMKKEPVKEAPKKTPELKKDAKQEAAKVIAPTAPKQAVNQDVPLTPPSQKKKTVVEPKLNKRVAEEEAPPPAAKKEAIPPPAAKKEAIPPPAAKKEAVSPAAAKKEAIKEAEIKKEAPPPPPVTKETKKEPEVKKPAPPPPKEAPKPKPAANPKKKSNAPIKVDDKFVVEIGPGGCRGNKWNQKPWPVEAGRMSLESCAKYCKKAGCKAFHVLREKEDGSAECFLFGNEDVIVVKGLGGKCYTLSNKPPSSKPSQDDDEDDEIDLIVKRPIRMDHIGNGRCRGEGWANKKWPVLAGYQTKEKCAEFCAQRMGCVAFDLSEPKGQPLKHYCVLYGHHRISVTRATSLPGECWVLLEKDPKDLAYHKGLHYTDLKNEEKEVEKEEEDEVEKNIVGPVYMTLMDQGRCRGVGWTDRKWPIEKGPMTPKDCSIACAKRKGCTAFDMAKKKEEGGDECTLYGHKGVVPAYGVAGKCYSISDKPTPKVTVRKERQEKDDGVTHKFIVLGRGMCRGANWQENDWPVQKGMKTLQECANSCGRITGCTSFDTSQPEGNKFECMLYGHKTAVPASGVPGTCYSLQGAKYVEPPKQKKADKPEAKRSTIVEEMDVEDTKIKDVELLGKGACRGQGWQDEEWPIARGRQTLDECAQFCKSTVGCTAFDLSGKAAGKYDCFLLGHKDVLPASALAAKCYIIKGAKPAVIKPKDTPSATRQELSGSYPKSGDGFALAGSGLCRGPGWQSKNWPKDMGKKTALDCAGTCKQQAGCRAFDLSNEEKKQFSCLLFSHQEVIPATSGSMKGACYTLTNAKEAKIIEEETEEEDDDEEMIIDLEGDIDIALLGKGGCRGGGWQENNWPKSKGFLSVENCGRVCTTTRGCTAFHSAGSKDGKPNVFECFLFGHKSIVPASGLPGNCYTVISGSSTVIRSKPAPTAKPKKKKEYKIPEFDQPKVVEDEFEEDDDEWLFDPPPAEVRSREHITQILGLEEPSNDRVLKTVETTLKDLKKVYETAIKELEKNYKYKELSHRHFGDPEIFNKPLIVFLGPWSGGKSTMMNYLLGTEYTKNAFKSTAEPSPGFNFNIAMYGETEDEVDGTELSAEWAFSSLQKFGMEFLRKLRGKKMPNKLLEKATFAEIPGVLETGTIRKIDRRYPFNDACQWFIDHADLIVMVYDYAKLDIGPETEALLDQLKGRESQVRIVLNKADEITAEELLKIQGNLVWNVSPLMASMEPPTLYAGSFWSKPYKIGSPKRLLKAQEQSLLRDIREAIDKRVENRIATARRFAVRVRNHAKMVDVYLTTFNNNKGMFSDKKRVAKDIIENPQKYHIYEGISTLTNISRYDLPDPDAYKDFFNVHPLYDFPTLQSTCTFFRGCPLNKLDISIAYEIPELLTRFKKQLAKAKLPEEAPKDIKKETKKTKK